MSRFTTANQVRAATDLERLQVWHKKAYVLRGPKGLVYSCAICRQSGTFNDMLKRFCK
jgi:hypothetical protein